MDLTAIFADEGISEFGVIDFDKLCVINKKLLPKTEIRSAVMLLVPYRCGNFTAEDGFNAGLFARCLDYHGYFTALWERIVPKLRLITNGEVYGFADHSPIAEKDAAHKCGLGFIGRNSLLINRRYGSFVFIGTLLFENKLEERIFANTDNCGACNACVNACPTKAIGGDVDIKLCISAISQKKNKTEDDAKAIATNSTVWGCDICQNACPYNKNAENGRVEYFKKNLIHCFSAELINTMSEEEYKSRAFSFRERKVIVENILTAVNYRGIIDT